MISSQIITFIDQTEDIFLFNNLENVKSVYHYSVPNTKLLYPEPFIASSSFMHSDLWFVHILIYQYWLWFIFVFIIVFFFLTFLCTIRWCNMRVRPRRETRGVSRSKCGDLITATVPVTWATSIIVNESTDAIDYYDGFGTTELVIGVRAYQWGWEYYYPKDIDLNYNIKPNYSVFMGNSLKYSKTSDVNLHSNNLWKFYQNKTFDHVVTPAHMLAIPLDNNKLINFMNFNDIGSNSVIESNAFKKIRMFSKTYTTNLSFIPSSRASKFKTISNLYLNDNSYVDSYLYGLKRQHSFLSNSSVFNNYSTFLNLKSVNKLAAFNAASGLVFTNKLSDLSSLLKFQKFNVAPLTAQLVKISRILSNSTLSVEPRNLQNFFIYADILNLINDNTDKKIIKNPFLKVFNKAHAQKSFLVSLNTLNTLNDFSDVSLTEEKGGNDRFTSFFNNRNVNYKSFALFSNNQTIPLASRNIRNFLTIAPSTPHLNLSTSLNALSELLSSSANRGVSLNTNLFFNSFSTDWTNSNTTVKLLTTRVAYEYPYSPIASNSALINTLNHDSRKFTFVKNVPNVLQGKEDLMPGFLPSIYWNFYWSNSTPDWRLNNVKTYGMAHSFFYLPVFSFYYDYDFRNWQSFELLEDAFWESVYSVYNHDEYLTLSKDFLNYEYFEKLPVFFNKSNRVITFKDKIIYRPFFKDLSANRGHDYPNYLYVDGFVSPTATLLNKDFFVFPLNFSFTSAEESFDASKALSHLFEINNKSIQTARSHEVAAHSYLLVLNMFRSDFDDFSWYADDSNFFTETNNFYPVKFFLVNGVFFNFSDFSQSFAFTPDKFDRFTSGLNLRNTAKNSIVTYNAIQKVFKTRFDENRSHTKLNDFSSFYTKQPLISAGKTPYEKLLGKNKNSFFKINFYKNSFKPLFNDLYDLTSSLNFYFYDFPFLLALKSDSSRYLWFDWFAKWGYYEVQPSSSSRYAIYGMPYFSKNFEFNTSASEALNESENYLTRISKARRNYLPNWSYTPYFYAKNNVWNKNNSIFSAIDVSGVSLVSTLYALNGMSWYWNDLYFFSFNSYQFLPSNSGISSYARSASKPQNSIQSYFYTVNSLVDILTKREYLYRELLFLNNKIINLPFYLTNSPKNPLITEIKASFNFIDPIVSSNEHSRDSYYTSLTFFNYNVLKSLISAYGDILNLNVFTDFFIFYFFDVSALTSTNSNAELYKNQYRPMRKGVTNMIRLHATGAMALPIEIRLQVLASSKDVIHSWAIPSAGIKIDCVPGYSSHRVMIFLVSGIFWGQCMEICGRYHHWMPIVVYFMKRDLFFLWCTHFIFLSGANNMWTINDKQYSDYVRLASFDKNTWLSELVL